MIALQTHTLWIWLIASEALFAILLGIVWSRRRRERALIRWTLASACVALGGLGAGLYGRWPEWPVIAIANVLFGLGWSLRWSGLRQFSGQRPQVFASLVPPLLLGLAFLWHAPLGLDAADLAILALVLGAAYVLQMTIDGLCAQRSEALRMRAIVIAIGVLTLMMQVGSIAVVRKDGLAAGVPPQMAVNAYVLLGLIAAFALYAFGCLLMMFERHERRLVHDAMIDPLTGVPNRAGFRELAGRQRLPLSVLVMDLDNFKQINDTYGHEGGDAVLRAFARTARDALRPSDLLARSGGEEFWAVLPQAGLADARGSAQRLCDRFRDVQVPFKEQCIAATVSIGVAEVSVRGETIQAAIARADRALYEAKRLGRDRVTTAGLAPRAPAGQA